MLPINRIERLVPVQIGGDARLGSCRVPIERRGGCRLLDRLRLGLAGGSRVMEDDTAVR
jgi:hypothetical protein